jgi:hypothetical protein
MPCKSCRRCFLMASARHLAANLLSGIFSNVFRILFHLVMLPLMARLVGPPWSLQVKHADEATGVHAFKVDIAPARQASVIRHGGYPARRRHADWADGFWRNRFPTQLSSRFRLTSNERSPSLSILNDSIENDRALVL